MLDDLFEEYAGEPERMEELEQRLGIPISYASRSVVCYSQKVKATDRDGEKDTHLCLKMTEDVQS